MGIAALLRIPDLGTPSKLTLEFAGIAGLFGGNEAFSAMATVHLLRGRRWLGWFNSPGSYTIAKRFGRMANTRFWGGLFPGLHNSPTISLGLDGKNGPPYITALSGTKTPTGHLAYLTMKRSKESHVVDIAGRETIPVYVSYLVMNPVDHEPPVKRLPIKSALSGLIPITVSVVTCIMCALVYDWFSFSMILLGIISNGLATVVIGERRLYINTATRHPSGLSAGHGMLMGEDEVVVIKGKERDVNTITKGRFVLQTNTKQRYATNGNIARYHAIGACSLLLLVQSLLQLLLVPQGTLFGKIMFLVSLGASWGYNCYLSSFEKEKMQSDMLFEALGNPTMLRFCTGTRPTAAVFICLLLFHGVERSSPEEDRAQRLEILKSCIPVDTEVWQRWRERVVEQLLKVDDPSNLLSYLADEMEDPALSKWDRELLKVLLDDASTAFRGYFEFMKTLSGDNNGEELGTHNDHNEDGVLYIKLREV